MKQLQEFDTIEDAQTYVAYKQITSNKAEQFFSLSGTKDKILNKASDTTEVEIIPGTSTTIANLCNAILDTLKKSNGHFEIDPENQDGAFNQLAIAELVTNSVITQDEADMFISLGVYYPYESKTSEEFTHNSNMANAVYTAKTIENWNGQDVVIELKETLPVKCALTTWVVEEGFETENAGKVKHVQAATKYRLKLSGVKVGSNLEFRIPFENVDYTVS